MQTVLYGKTRVSTEKVLLFWVLLGSLTAFAIYALGHMVEAVSQSTSLYTEHAAPIDGLWRGTREVARVSAAPRGIRVVLWEERGLRLRLVRDYHLTPIRTIGSAMVYADRRAGQGKAIWDGPQLTLALPDRSLVLRR